jgi:lysozyme
MNINDYTPTQGLIQVLAAIEGIKLRSYICPAGKLTVGIGHVIFDGDYVMEEVLGVSKASEVVSITKDQAFKMLALDLRRFTQVLRLNLRSLDGQLEVSDFPKLDALISFMFNVGAQAFITSTLMKKLLAPHRYSFEDMAAEFLRWTKATVNGTKRDLPGLIIRRHVERAIFLQNNLQDLDNFNLTRTQINEIIRLYRAYNV